MENKDLKPMIGLEVHVELKTESKMFCSCSSKYFGQEPNAYTCPVCLGLPGALPVPNKKAIEWCVAIGMALNCKVSLFSKFDRKNYFYPDLSKGYQISQYDKPFSENGYIALSSGRKIGIRRVHMEEDTAKLTHQFGIQNSKFKIQNYEQTEKYTLIDFNRSGVPLVEIVTEPDFHSALEVREYLQKLQQIVRYLEVSEADMEKGQMRLEPNISLQEFVNGNLQIVNKYKVEVKNINSFKFVEKAINYELERQKKILLSGKIPTQETRGWDDKKQITVTQRIKEEANDYRYFPEPDIPPIRWSEKELCEIKEKMPELPDEKKDRFKKEYKLLEYDAEILTREKFIADYFEETVKVNEELKKKNEKSLDIKTIANWIIHKKPDLNQILPAELIKTILSATEKVAIDEKELEKIINEVLQENQKAVEDYKKGKEGVIMFIVGQVMRKFKQKIDAELVKEIIKKHIK